jgi:hypothetical protein
MGRGSLVGGLLSQLYLMHVSYANSALLQPARPPQPSPARAQVVANHVQTMPDGFVPHWSSDGGGAPYREYQIGRQAPWLSEVNSRMHVEEVRHMNHLFTELTEHTGYLTEWGERPAEAQQTLRFALEVAYLAHRGQKRRSGEPFIIHPVQVSSSHGRTCLGKPAASAVVHLPHEQPAPLPVLSVRPVVGRDMDMDHGPWNIDLASLTAGGGCCCCC